MRNTLFLSVMCFGSVASPFQPAFGQAGDRTAIMRAAATFISRDIPLMQLFKDRSPIVLVPSPLADRLVGRTVVSGAVKDGGNRTASEVAELASILHAAIGSLTDTIWCSRERGCQGTEGMEVQLGEPSIQSDSASVIFTVKMRTGTTIPSVLKSRYAISLRRFANGWRVTGYSGANQSPITEPHPVDSLTGLPVRIPKAGAGG